MTTAVTETASATMAIAFTKAHEAAEEAVQTLQSIMRLDGFEGAAADAWAAEVTALIVPMNAMSDPSQQVAAILNEEQVGIDLALVKAKGDQISKQDQVAAVVAKDTGRMTPQEFGQLRDYRDAADEAYAAAVLAHERDTSTTQSKVGDLDLPEGDEKSPGDDGGDGGFTDGDDPNGDGHGGRGSEGESDKPTEEPPTPSPDAAPPSDDVAAPPSSTTTPSTTPTPATSHVSDNAANTNLSSDGAIPTGASALSTSAVNPQSQMPQVPQSFTGGGSNSVGANPNAPWNPARRAAEQKKREEDDAARRAAEAVTPVVGGIAAGAAVADAAQPPSQPTHTTGAPSTPPPTVAEKFAAQRAAQQQANQQMMAAGGLGGGAKLMGGTGTGEKKPPADIPAADQLDKPKPNKNDSPDNKEKK